MKNHKITQETKQLLEKSEGPSSEWLDLFLLISFIFKIYHMNGLESNKNTL